MFPADVNDNSVAEAEDMYVRIGAEGNGLPWGSLLVATGSLVWVASLEYRKGV